MTTLLSDVIVNTGLIQKIGTDRPLPYFSTLNFKKIVIAIAVVIILVIVSFMLKRKYYIKKLKDEIILRGFYEIE
jgi:hypothetical protein